MNDFDNTNGSDSLRRLLDDSSNESLDSKNDDLTELKPGHQACLLDSRGERKSSILLDEYGGSSSDETLQVTVKNANDDEEDKEDGEEIPEDNEEDNYEIEREIDKIIEEATTKLIKEATDVSTNLKEFSEAAKSIDQSLDESQQAIATLSQMMKGEM